MQLVEFKNYKGEILRGLLDAAKSQCGVIFLHGFERTTVEMKFKNLRDALIGKINIFRFDFSGCGLSDGNFEDVNIKKMTQELAGAIAIFKNKIPQLKKIILVAHSLSCCAALNFTYKTSGIIEKIVLLGPALNQKELLKYYFVRAKMYLKKIDIDWSNYQQFFEANEYQPDLQIKKRMRKSHWLSNKYFLENQNQDYQEFFKKIKLPLKNILVVQGDSDDKVPRESNDNLPKKLKQITVLKGDHDLERPDMVGQYLSKIKKFILN